MSPYEPQQPVLTSHELTAHRVGSSRGKQRFDVQRSERHDGNGSARRDERPRFDRTSGNKRSNSPRSPREQKPKGFDHDALLQTYKGVAVTIASISGVAIRAKIVDGDRYTLVVEEDGHRVLIFKSAIASIAFDKVEVTSA